MRPALAWIAMLFAASGVPTAYAQEMLPGLWEIAVESRVRADPGFAPAPFRMTQCFSAEDARDPGRLLAQVSNPGATGCRYAERRYEGNTLTFTVQCSGNYALVSRGRVAFTPGAMDGSIDATADVGGSRVEMQNRITARRTGGC